MERFIKDRKRKLAKRKKNTGSKTYAIVLIQKRPKNPIFYAKTVFSPINTCTSSYQFVSNCLPKAAYTCITYCCVLHGAIGIENSKTCSRNFHKNLFAEHIKIN